jgi:exodeoxyribonuclease-5
MKRIFKFKDGSFVLAPFELNHEQKEALLKLEEFVNNPTKFDNQITLVGYAGTGKTTIIGLFDQYLSRKKIKKYYTSPTHRANAVTKMKNPNAHVITLHSLFGLGPEIRFENGDYDIKDLTFARKNKPKIKKNDTIIVDESSMVSESLYGFLETWKRDYDIKIIYVGDPAQLKPVKDSDISPVFKKGETINLTIVERTGDNSILKESTNLRKGEDFSYISDIREKGSVQYVKDSELARKIINDNFTSEEFNKNKLFFRILSGTNSGVTKLNDYVRQELFKTNEQVVVGDILMGYNNFDIDYETKEPLIINSGDYQVLKVDKGTKLVSIDGGELIFSGFYLVLKNLMSDSDDNKSIFVVDNNESEEKIQSFVEDIANKNRLGAKFMQTDDYYQAKLAFQDARKTESQLAFMRNIKDSSGKNKIKQTLGYGYAHTIHKSQGGTYSRVFVLDDTIKRFNDKQVEQQLKYVAMSRATDFVYVYTP